MAGFGYFESADDDAAVLSEVRRILAPYGKVLIDFTDGEYQHRNFDARPMSTVSKRNQDLGMMANRILVAARSTKSQPATRPVKSRLQHVAVLMGDHRKPDSTFDDDDYHTISELKKALASHSGYRFSYLDNHDTLIAICRRRHRKSNSSSIFATKAWVTPPRGNCTSRRCWRR